MEVFNYVSLLSKYKFHIVANRQLLLGFFAGAQRGCAEKYDV